MRTARRNPDAREAETIPTPSQYSQRPNTPRPLQMLHLTRQYVLGPTGSRSSIPLPLQDGHRSFLDPWQAGQVVFVSSSRKGSGRSPAPGSGVRPGI